MGGTIRAMNVAYTHGLHELGDGLFAFLQPDGGWGWANAGLVTGGGTSLLVDTLYDHALTHEMLDAMAPHTEAHPIEQAMNTHANPDHCFGNDLLPSTTEIVASARTAEEMTAVSPELLNALKSAELEPELRDFVDHAFGPFEYEGIEVRLPDRTFEGTLDLAVGERSVSLIELGPAHTGGDTIVHVPDASTVFTGDLLFIEGAPVVWAGPFSNWIAACDRIRALEARTIVPGHGPVTDASGVDDVKSYLEDVHAQARERFDAGLDAEAAADDIDLSDYADWGDLERIVVNVATAYREFDPSLPEITPVEHFVGMARWRARH
jgi:cyclase